MPETLTPKQVLLTDEIANEKYVGFYAERRLSRMVITAGSVLLLGSFGVIVSLSHRPIQNRYIRIDEMGKATAIQYSDLAYSPREGEVRTYLTDWANYRYNDQPGDCLEEVPNELLFPVHAARQSVHGRGQCDALGLAGSRQSD